jgi:4-amino-4-deoxy-L-arabinose transferase-like glycosyltransferase
MRYKKQPELLLVGIIALALILRLIVVFTITPPAPNDTPWYLNAGELVITNRVDVTTAQPFAPLFSLIAGTFKHWFGYDQALVGLRLLLAVLGAITCGFIWRIAYRLTQDARIATVAGLGLALNPIFLIENDTVLTETLFLFLLLWALSIYINATEITKSRLAASGALLGLAALTRAAIVAFPLGLAIHLGLIFPWRQALRKAGLLLLVYVLVLGTWTVYTGVKFNRFVIGASGASDMLLSATVGYEGSPQVDEKYAQYNGGTVPSGSDRDSVAMNVVTSTITSNPLGYIKTRLSQLGEALLQPHQTVYFAGESLKDLLLNWLRADRTLVGLSRVISGENFWPKLSIYIFHFLVLFAGLIGIVLTRRDWKKYAPLTGLIAYTLLLHFFLLATPRYLLPITPALWVFAGVTLIRGWERLRNTVSRQQNSAQVVVSQVQP